MMAFLPSHVCGRSLFREALDHGWLLDFSSLIFQVAQMFGSERPMLQTQFQTTCSIQILSAQIRIDEHNTV